MNLLYRITGRTASGRFCAGLVYDEVNEHIIVAAPILQWTRRRRDWIDYCIRRGWNVEPVCLDKPRDS